MFPSDGAAQSVRNLQPLPRESAATAPDAGGEQASRSAPAAQGSKNNGAAVRNLAIEAPTGRIVYLDEQLMRQIALRLANDPECFQRLSTGAKSITPVTIKTVPDAVAADPVFYAKVVWTLPSTNTLLSFGMPQSGRPVFEPYPQAVVRIRCSIPPTGNFTAERFTCVTSRGERVTVLMGAETGLSANRSFLRQQTLFVVGTLRKVANATVSAGAVLI